MGEKNRRFTITLILIAIIIFQGFALFKSAKRNEELQSLIPYLTPGETIEDPALVCVGDIGTDITELEKDRTWLLYILPRTSCSACDKNLVVIKKIAKYFKQEVSVVCIVVNTPSVAEDFAGKVKAGFPIYVPADVEAFTEAFRVRFNMPQTVIYSGGEVRHVQIGDLTGATAAGLIKRLRSMKEVSL